MNILKRISFFGTTKLRLYAIFVCLVILISIFNFGYALNFHFYMDDWGNIWYVLTDNKSGYEGQFNIHPGNYLVFLPVIKLFGLNPIPYNYLGLCTKIILSLVIGFLALTLLKRKDAFFYATVLYASYFGSLESYMWATARNNAFNLLAVAATIIFYIKSYFSQKKFLFTLSMFFLFMGFFADPARMIFLPFLLIVSDFIQTWTKEKSLKKVIRFRLLIVFAVSLLGIFSTELGRSIILPGSQSQHGYIFKAFSDPSYFQNFLLGLGYLITSYFILPNELLANAIIPTGLTTAIGGVFLVSLVVIGLYNITKGKDINYGIFIPGGIILFLFLNWVAFPYLIPVIQHRYQVISSAFFIVFLTGIILKFKKHSLKLLLLFIVMNLWQSFIIVSDWNSIRDFSKVQSLIDTQLNYIPKNAKPEMFVLQGNKRIVVEQLAWSAGGTIPYSIKYQINDVKNMPAFVADWTLITEVFCNKRGSKPVVGEWVKQEKSIDISNVYGFKVDDHERILDVTDDIRLQILGTSECSDKIALTGGDLTVKPEFYIRSTKLKSASTGIFVKWKILNPQISRLNITYTPNKSMYTMKERSFDIKNEQINQKEFSHNLFFENAKDQAISILVEISYCQTIGCENKTEFKENIQF